MNHVVPQFGDHRRLAVAARGQDAALARLLIDFHRYEDREVAGFDVNSGDETLAQFLPKQVTPGLNCGRQGTDGAIR